MLNFGDALGMEVIVRPHHATWLQDTALRDLALHEGHAACVDARGDVYQWGDAFFASCSATAGGNPLKPTLQGKVGSLFCAPYELVRLTLCAVTGYH